MWENKTRQLQMTYKGKAENTKPLYQLYWDRIFLQHDFEHNKITQEGYLRIEHKL